MIWRSTAQILLAFVIAWAAVWFSPLLLPPLGLNEFVFVGQLSLGILTLSLLDAAFNRIFPPETGTAEHPPPDP